MRGYTRAIGAATLIIFSVLTVTAAVAQRSPPRVTTFGGLSFSPTNGKVGYHLVALSHIAQSPCPPGGNLVGSFTVTGELPPGMNPPDTAVPRFSFEGTPGQPGDWDVVVTAHDVGCSGNLVTYGNLTASVHFHIDP